MKKYQIMISETARQDLRAVYDYVTEVSFERNAKWVLEKIKKHIMSFREFPERTEPFGVSNSGEKLRATVVGKYRVIYIVDKNSGIVKIIHVMYVGRDLKEVYRDED